jgi:hypothetical protein
MDKCIKTMGRFVRPVGYHRRNCMPRRAALATAAVLAAVLSIRPAAAPSRTDEIVARAGSYVSDFVRRFSSIVAEERFVQDARRLNSGARGRGSGSGQLLAPGVSVHRELVSDYLLVKPAGTTDWQLFRDVFEVDGRPVRARAERLEELFVQPSADALARALEIQREGARYNVGDPVRTLGNPLLTLGFLQPRYQPRFRFSLRDADPALGPDVWIVEFREQARPTLMRRTPDGDLPARGRFWIEFRTGRVLKTELAVSEEDEVTTTFRFDEQFQIALPVEMRESYWFGGTYVSGVAQYGRFRRFGVTVEERLK